jgi:hypothetical protein
LIIYGFITSKINFDFSNSISQNWDWSLNTWSSHNYFNKAPNLHEKPVKGFKNLYELKKAPDGARVIIQREKNKLPKVIGFCMRRDLEKTVKKLEKKYN